MEKIAQNQKMFFCFLHFASFLYNLTLSIGALVIFINHFGESNKNSRHGLQV